MSAPLTWSHRTAEIPEAGLREMRTATSAERSAIAQALDVLSCESMTAEYSIRPLGQGRYRMVGDLSAQLIQNCVVTVEPIATTIEESLDVGFWPEESLPDSVEFEVEALSIPEIEPIEHEMIAAGRVLFECLAAALDPYPRKEGVRFEWEDPKGATEVHEEGPFASLKKLKKRG